VKDLGRVVTGKTPPTKRPELFGDVYPFITPSEMSYGERTAHPVRYLSELGRTAQKNLLLPSGSVAFVCIASIGKACLVREPSFTNQQVNSIIVDSEKHSPEFVYYLLTSERDRIKRYASGAATPIINKGDFGNIEVQVPPLPTQQRIASVLSAYDDLIENNTRRIAILEEMARRLYEEWFVHFRFPGHKEVAFVEGETGMTPADWPVVPLEDLVLVNPRTTVPREGCKPFVPMGSLSETNMTIGPIEEREGNSGTKFQNGDTLVARITPCLENGKTGFVNFLDEERPVAFGSTEFIVLRPLILGQHAIYCLGRSHAFRDVAIKSMSGSEGRQRVRPESVKSFPTTKPPAALLDRFEQIAQPIFAQVSALARKNTNLRAQRDLLLPKLVSGEIDVSEAEEAMEAAE
jgi:type I restriction enzyme S subunit